MFPVSVLLRKRRTQRHLKSNVHLLVCDRKMDRLMDSIKPPKVRLGTGSTHNNSHQNTMISAGADLEEAEDS